MHQRIAGKLIAADMIQTIAMTMMIRCVVMRCGYLIALVMARYRSRAIPERFRIEAVLARTSNECQTSHQSLPNIHRCCITSSVIANGMTTAPITRSATANDTMR